MQNTVMENQKLLNIKPFSYPFTCRRTRQRVAVYTVCKALSIQLEISVFLYLFPLSPQQELWPPNECSAADDSILNGFIFNLLTERLLLYSDLQIGTSC